MVMCGQYEYDRKIGGCMFLMCFQKLKYLGKKFRIFLMKYESNTISDGCMCSQMVCVNNMSDRIIGGCMYLVFQKTEIL